MTDADRDSLESYLLMCRCLHEEVREGRKLTPKEMLERVEAREE